MVYVYLHLVDVYGKCSYTYNHTHGPPGYRSDEIVIESYP